jgi:hypothetical protein
LTGLDRQYQLNRTFGFLLDRHDPVSDTASGHEIANANSDQIAASQLAVDRKIEQRPIPQSVLPVQHEPNLPHLLRLQRSLRAKLPSCVPSRPLLNGSYGEYSMILLRRPE